MSLARSSVAWAMCALLVSLAPAGCREPDESVGGATYSTGSGSTAPDPSDAGEPPPDTPTGGGSESPTPSTTGASTTTGEGAETSSATLLGGQTSGPLEPNPPSCGDWMVNPGEACDEGTDNLPVGHPTACDYCSTECTLERYCGDGVVQADCGEQCDPGRAMSSLCDPDCQFRARIVFVTSESYAGDLGGVEEAHVACNEHADAARRAWAAGNPGLSNPWQGKHFRAWISDGSAENCPFRALNDADEFEPLPYRMPGGIKVADSVAALPKGIDHAIDRDEFGDPIFMGHVWTNTRENGHPASAKTHCMDWTWEEDLGFYPCLEDTALCGVVGRIDVFAAGELWTYDPEAAQMCSMPVHLYCFEQP